MTNQLSECPNCHNANKYGDYEGQTCEVCKGDGWIAPPTLADHSTMLERVAKAICNAGRGGEDLWDVLTHNNSAMRTSYLEEARAALQALRTPTQGMLDGPGIDTLDSAKTEWMFVRNDRCVQIWTEMIDAALSEHDDGMNDQAT